MPCHNPQLCSSRRAHAPGCPLQSAGHSPQARRPPALCRCAAAAQSPMVAVGRSCSRRSRSQQSIAVAVADSRSSVGGDGEGYGRSLVGERALARLRQRQSRESPHNGSVTPCRVPNTSTHTQIHTQPRARTCRNASRCLYRSSMAVTSLWRLSRCSGTCRTFHSDTGAPTCRNIMMDGPQQQ
jgi:hypothetical protein